MDYKNLTPEQKNIISQRIKEGMKRTSIKGYELATMLSLKGFVIPEQYISYWKNGKEFQKLDDTLIKEMASIFKMYDYEYLQGQEPSCLSYEEYLLHKGMRTDGINDLETILKYEKLISEYGYTIKGMSSFGGYILFEIKTPTGIFDVPLSEMEAFNTRLGNYIRYQMEALQSNYSENMPTTKKGWMDYCYRPVLNGQLSRSEFFEVMDALKEGDAND